MRQLQVFQIKCDYIIPILRIIRMLQVSHRINAFNRGRKVAENQARSGSTERYKTTSGSNVPGASLRKLFVIEETSCSSCIAFVAGHMATVFLWGFLLVSFLGSGFSDIYLHFPPGSNNRLNGNQANVRNANRLFDSQVRNAAQSKKYTTVFAVILVVVVQTSSLKGSMVPFFYFCLSFSVITIDDILQSPW